MKQKLIYILLLIACTACHSHKEPAAHEDAAYPANTVYFSEEQSEKIRLETALPIRETFGQVIKTTARILSAPTDETIVAARTEGVVTLAAQPVTEGMTVAAGQPLLNISGAGLAANSLNTRIVEAQSNYEKASADYRRAQTLIDDRIISEKAFLQIKADYETAKAIYDNLNKNFSPAGQPVVSPLPGYVRQLLVANGQHVAPGDPLIVIAQNRSLLLKADVSPKYAALLHTVRTAVIQSMNQSTSYTLEELNGRFLSFGKSINDDNYLIPVTFRIDSRAGFVPGGFVTVHIQTSTGAPVLTIPNTALTEQQGAYFVYIRRANEQFEQREVQPGLTNGIRTEILAGLDGSEQVVTRGAISIKLARTSGAVDPHTGHDH
jgi:RND family efflux transporter MFP subunit